MILALFLIMVNGEAKLCCKPPFTANGGSTAYFNCDGSREIKKKL